jgi:protoporphyrinogen oxidase
VISRAGEQQVLEANHVWSTLPISMVARMVEPAPAPAVLQAASAIEYRAMILVYLQLAVDQFTTTDAHYFPEAHIAMTRLSEPKNYWASTEPKGTTTLCAELPCSVNDALWSMKDEELGARVVEDLARAGLPLDRPPIGVMVKRLQQAYPIYTKGYETPFGVLDEWAENLPGFLVYGRQGLFAHDNLHHALYMAYSAVDCLEGDRFNQARWADYRKIFATHVVED